MISTADGFLVGFRNTVSSWGTGGSYQGVDSRIRRITVRSDVLAIDTSLGSPLRVGVCAAVGVSVPAKRFSLKGLTSSLPPCLLAGAVPPMERT